MDPTNSEGMLEESVPWFLVSGVRLPVPTVSTLLARINEPVKHVILRTTSYCYGYGCGLGF